MKILGINFFFHDTTACLVDDGRLVIAVEEERLNRQKHTTLFPERAIARCLEAAGLDYEDIDSIAVSIKPSKDWLKKSLYGLRHVAHCRPFLQHELLGGWRRMRNLRQWYARHWTDRRSAPTIHFVPHHSAHAAGTFLVSPFESAAILSLDGSGEWSTSFLGRGSGASVACLHESFFPMSLGSFYEAATEFCGFRPNYDEGKTMGLAPFGDPDRFHGPVSELLRVEDDGAIRIDLSYFDYQHWGHRRCSRKFEQTFGKARARDADFEQHHMDLAAAFQRVLEERALDLCHVLCRKSHERKLVLAGGVALNSVMNGRILRDSDFDDIYVMPAAGDSGTAIGAAYVAYNVLAGNPRDFVHDDPFVGTEYSDDEIASIIRASKLRAERHEDIASKAADLLSDGRIIGWFQGRMEIGPRALGNRSILANPLLADMKDKLNAEVKHREAYRPFAPATTIEDHARFFEDLGDNPFMLKVCRVRREHVETLPAVTHVDGTARVQTVRRQTNPRFHDLISAFGERTGVPVILNTSFNVMGEPIVESPQDAIRCFFTTGIDELIIGDYLIRK